MNKGRKRPLLLARLSHLLVVRWPPAIIEIWNYYKAGRRWLPLPPQTGPLAPLAANRRWLPRWWRRWLPWRRWLLPLATAAAADAGVAAGCRWGAAKQHIT